jgi:hypothetical protein
VVIIVSSGRVGGGRRELGCERAEHLHNLPVALPTHGEKSVIEICGGLVVSGRCGSGRAEKLTRAGDRRAALPVGEQAEVADTHEATREHVEHETPKELVDVERHNFRVGAIGIALPPKLDNAVDQPDEARVGDGDQPDPDPYGTMTSNRSVPVSRFRIVPISRRLSTTGNRSGVRARTTGGIAAISIASTALYRNTSLRRRMTSQFPHERLTHPVQNPHR